MTINTTRFGEVEISERSIVHMPEGMIGFESNSKYVLLEDKPDSPFKWLQSVDDPTLAFIVVDPLEFLTNYDIDLPDEDAKQLGLTSAADASILTTVTVNLDEGTVTTNLLGPVVINSSTLFAKQVVLQDERYGTKEVIGQKQTVDTRVEAIAA